ncbi:MAG: glutamate 5-kinase, partial [Rhodospirillales bacterium]
MTGIPALAEGTRVIVKIGSALLVDKERGSVKRAWLETLGADLMKLRARGQEVLIVSSGAIAVGRRHLGLPARGKLKLEESQAAAAAGMVRLAHAYQEVLGVYDVTVAQVLLTLDDSENRRRYLNARNTIDQIIRLGAVPLINENDTVATDEIRFGDNDRLAARVAAMVSADTLVLLSSSDGLYESDPSQDANAVHVPVVTGGITPEIEAMAGVKMTDDGSGG